MTEDRLLDRLRELDPSTPERVASASQGMEEIRREIESEPIDDLAIRRRTRRRRIGVTIAAAVVAAALLVPLSLLLPLGDDGSGVVGSVPSTGQSPSPTPTDEPSGRPTDPGPLDPIEVVQPAPGDTVTSPVTIRGTADVFEATVSIRIVDATNNVIADTFTTATCGTGCRGDYSIEVPYTVDTEQLGTIEVFEVSAEDGRPANLVRVPVTLAPGAEDPVATAVEGDWTAPDGTVAPNGDTGGTHVIGSSSGSEHCGWSSVTFLHLAWPVGTETRLGYRDWRQYVRDPQGVLRASTDGAFDPSATLPDDAAYTGYSRGTWQLWVAPADADRAVYVVNADPAAQGVVERWPRVPEPRLCD